MFVMFSGFSYWILAVFSAYFAILIGIAVFRSRQTQAMSDYVLGSRRVGAFTSALSASSSGASGWTILVFPALAFSPRLRGNHPHEPMTWSSHLSAVRARLKMNHFISKMGIPGISLVGLLAVALVGIGAFGSIWGTVQGQEDETMRDELAEARRQLIEDPSRGYVSKGGNTGRVTSIDSASGRVAIDTPKGETMVTIGDQTVIREYGSGNQMTSGDLANSKLVVIGSEQTSSGDVALLEVVPEGDDGYKISPASDDGPAMVPVFP